MLNDQNEIIMTNDLNNAIAIIGIAGRFPESENIKEFWDNLCNSKNCITSNFPFKEGNFIHAFGQLKNIEDFDADFFDIAPSEALSLDPQHRLFLELSWCALEDAGYVPDSYTGAIGVFGGTALSSYMLNNLISNKKITTPIHNYLIRIGNDKDFLTTRVSYKLNLTGPSVSIQTACSTSLVSVATACTHLLTYQCDLAIAGAVNVTVPQTGYEFQEGMIFSSDGKCRPFDAAAAGTVPGNGGGIVILKRYDEAIADNDHIYAIIAGYAVNNDGNDKVGYSAPSITGQARVILSAIEMAEVDPQKIIFLEAHGTGTILGDPIEFKALKEVFSSKTNATQFCALGSVKSNIGHLMEASGMASLIKASLALKYRILPATLNVSEPNPHIDFGNSPFYLNLQPQQLTSEYPLYAGVSSFGIGGTNSHIILREAPQKELSSKYRSHELLIFSAKSETALEKMLTNMDNFIEQEPLLSLSNLAYTLHLGRSNFPFKTFFVVESSQSLKKETLTYRYLNNKNTYNPISKEHRKLIFLCKPSENLEFTYTLYQDLYHTEPVFKSVFDQTLEQFNKTLKQNLNQFLYLNKYLNLNRKIDPESELITNCISFCIFYALGRLLLDWGIKPDFILGEELGEFLCACLSDLFSIHEAVDLIISYIRTKNPLLKEVEYKQYENLLEKTRFNNPSIPFLLNHYSKEYWLNILNDKTNYPHFFNTFDLNDDYIVLNFADSSTLIDSTNPNLVINLSPERNESLSGTKNLYTAIGKLWSAGIFINWNNYHRDDNAKRISIPSYPFEKERYWIEPIQDLGIDESISETGQKQNQAKDKISDILAILWKKILGLSQVNYDSSFFLLGGDSIQVIQLISEINDYFNLSISFQTLNSHETINKLSAELSRLQHIQHQEVERKNIPNLIKLKEDENSCNLFLIHPIEGFLNIYNELIKNLQFKGSIYGIEALKQPTNVDSIEQLASEYIKIIQSTQATGPYNLLGFSFGGILALEIANQLELNNQQIQLLTIIDSINPTFFNKSIDTNLIDQLIRLVSSKSIDFSLINQMSYDDKMDLITQQLGFKNISKNLADTIKMQIDRNITYLKNYQPKCYKGAVLFIEAENDLNVDALPPSRYSWSSIFKGAVSTYKIPGSHIEMMKNPLIKILTIILDRKLNQI